MSDPPYWWKAYCTPVEGANSRYTCSKCPETFDSRFGHPKRHLAKHGITPDGDAPEPVPEESADAPELTIEEIQRVVLNSLHDQTLHATRDADRTMAAKALADAPKLFAGLLEVDEEAASRKVVGKYRRHVDETRPELEKELKAMVRDPGIRQWVRRICDEAEAG